MPLSKPKTAKSKSISLPTTVSSFSILPLTLPALASLPAKYSSTKHYLYIKPHEPSHPTPTADRSLFLSNVPIDANEDNIRKLFAERLGGAKVASVEFDSSVPEEPTVKRYKTSGGAGGNAKAGKKRKRDEEIVAEGVVEDEESALPRIWPGSLRKSGSCAVVEFVDRASCKGAWREVKTAIKEGREVKWEGGGVVLGVERYKSHQHLRYPPKSILQSSINAYLTQFTCAENARNRLRKHQRSIPDEDGFITVTRGGRTGPARLEEAEKKQKELEERRKKNGVNDDFYRFQNREKRKEAENELRRKFEHDRRRVAEMRERRGPVRPE